MLYRKAMETIDRKARNIDLLNILNMMILIILTVFTLILIRDFTTRVYNTKDVKSPALFQAVGMEYAKKNLMEYEPVLINNPFGFKSGALKLLGGSSGRPLPASDMKLIGTTSGSDMLSYAVFAGSDGKQEIYKSGALIPGNGLLKQIERNKVFIEKEDTVSEIPMAESAVTDTNMASVSNESPSFVKKLDKGEYIIDQKLINKALDNPGQFISNARLIPNMKNNRQEGFILRQVKEGGIHYRMGLRNEDILLRMNDYDITNPESALRAFTALRGMDKINLDIIRSGKRTTVTFQIR